MKKNIDTELDKIVRAIKRTVDIEKIILFGSYAKENQKTESDIDICIITDGKKNIQTLWKIREAIFDISTHPIDLLLFNSDEFKEREKSKTSMEHEIKQTGILLYG